MYICDDIYKRGKKKTIGEGMTGRLEVVCLFGYLENCWVRERKG